MSAPPQVIQNYRVQDFQLRGKCVPVVLYRRGGSSALVALSNAIIQGYDFKSALIVEGGMRGRPKYVKTESLCQMIEMATVQRLQKAFDENLIDVVLMLQSWNGFKSTISLLPKLFCLDPILTSCVSFAKTPFVDLFTLLGFNLCHCLMVDPKADPETATAIGSKSYNEIADDAEPILNNFLDNAKDGLTAYGLKCLERSMNPLQLSVLFRNNHFYMIAKSKDEGLIVLQASEEEYKKNPDAMWKVLEKASGNEKLLRGDFSEIKQPEMGHDSESIALKMQEALIEEETQEKMKKSKLSSKQRRRLKNKTSITSPLQVQQPENVVACAKETKELKGSKPSEEQEEGQEEFEESEEQRDDNMSEMFNVFLEEFKEEGTSVPFFEGQVKAMNHCNSFKLRIMFKDLESHDVETARYLCDNMPRIYDRLKDCACKFLLKHHEFKTKPDVFEKTSIEICDLPDPNSFSSAWRHFEASETYDEDPMEGRLEMSDDMLN